MKLTTKPTYGMRPTPALGALPPNGAGAPKRRQTAPKSARKVPSKLQYRFGLVLMEELGKLRPQLSDRQLAEKAGINRHTLTSWRRKPAFVDWLSAFLSSRLDPLWAAGMVRMGVLASQGSAEHFKALGQAMGHIGSGGGRMAVSVGGGTTPAAEAGDQARPWVISHIPRPLSDYETLPDIVVAKQDGDPDLERPIDPLATMKERDRG